MRCRYHRRKKCVTLAVVESCERKAKMGSLNLLDLRTTQPSLNRAVAISAIKWNAFEKGNVDERRECF